MFHIPEAFPQHLFPLPQYLTSMRDSRVFCGILAIPISVQVSASDRDHLVKRLSVIARMIEYSSKINYQLRQLSISSLLRNNWDMSESESIGTNLFSDKTILWASWNSGSLFGHFAWLKLTSDERQQSVRRRKLTVTYVTVNVSVQRGTEAVILSAATGINTHESEQSIPNWLLWRERSVTQVRYRRVLYSL